MRHHKITSRITIGNWDPSRILLVAFLSILKSLLWTVVAGVNPWWLHQTFFMLDSSYLTIFIQAWTHASSAPRDVNYARLLALSEFPYHLIMSKGTTVQRKGKKKKKKKPLTLGYHKWPWHLLGKLQQSLSQDFICLGTNQLSYAVVCLFWNQSYSPPVILRWTQGPRILVLRCLMETIKWTSIFLCFSPLTDTLLHHYTKQFNTSLT